MYISLNHANDVDIVLVVLSQFELLTFVEQIEQLPTVDLEERQFGLEMTETVLYSMCVTLERLLKMSYAPRE